MYISLTKKNKRLSPSGCNRCILWDKKWQTVVCNHGWRGSISQYTLTVCMKWLWSARKGACCWLLEFQQGVSHFLFVNLSDVYCHSGDEQQAPTQHSTVYFCTQCTSLCCTALINMILYIEYRGNGSTFASCWYILLSVCIVELCVMLEDAVTNCYDSSNSYSIKM